MDEVENFFCQFPNPWALRVSGMGGYTSKCEKSQNHCTLMYIQYFAWGLLGGVDVKWSGGLLVLICIDVIVVRVKG